MAIRRTALTMAKTARIAVARQGCGRAATGAGATGWDTRECYGRPRVTSTAGAGRWSSGQADRQALAFEVLADEAGLARRTGRQVVAVAEVGEVLQRARRRLDALHNEPARERPAGDLRMDGDECRLTRLRIDGEKSGRDDPGRIHVVEHDLAELVGGQVHD